MKQSFIEEITIKAVGCDGTSSNTGIYNGAVLLFENALKHPVQAVVCLPHLNELQLMKVLIYLNGPTSGPSTYSDPIGKCLENCQELAVVNYDKIYSTFADVDFKNLSINQKCLWHMCQVVLAGECFQDMASRKHRNISHTR